ncbi:hypothetical protein ACWD4J_07060 [Streptomyces sp. NPDC002577]
MHQVVGERRAERWLGASTQQEAGAWRRLRARRAWDRLCTAAERDDPHALALLCRTARDREHPRHQDAGQVIADCWAASRAPQLRQVVLESGALASGGRALLQTAALHGWLSDLWPAEQASEAEALLADPDPAIRSAAEETCATASGPLLEALWRTVVPYVVREPKSFQAVSATMSSSSLASVLLRNPQAPPAPALDQLWGAWLQSADEHVLTALSAWGRPARKKPERGQSLIVVEPDPRRLTEDPSFRAELFRAATRTDHPLGDLARQVIFAALTPDLVEVLCDAALADRALVTFCAEHRLAPKDPVRRVLFFLLTEQLDQYRGMDPDGRLLELAYASADQETRSRLQKAMRTAGGLDLARVLVGSDRRTRIPEMSEGELSYLARQLADRGEWPQLWALVQDVALTTGLGLMRLFEGWTPRDEDSRRVFELMRQADPAEVRAAAAGLRKTWPLMQRQSRVRFDGRVNSVSFAPDAPLLAVAGTKQVAGVIDLSQGRLAERYDGFNSSVGHILHTGKGCFVAAERSNTNLSANRVLWCSGGSTKVLHQERGPVTSLALRGADGSFAAGTRQGALLLGTPGGEVEQVPVKKLGLDPKRDWPRAVTAHLASGRLAVLARGLVLTDSTARKVLARGEAGTITGHAVFTGPDTLVVASKGGTIQRVRRQGHKLVPGVHNAAWLFGLEALPERNEVLVVERTGRRVVLGATDLELRWESETSKQAAAQLLKATSAHLSPRGEFLAVGYDGGYTDLYDLRAWNLPALINRPLVSCVPADLGVAAAARSSGGELEKASRTFLDLMHGLLEYRFRFDIEIGDVSTLTAGEYDISL